MPLPLSSIYQQALEYVISDLPGLMISYHFLTLAFDSEVEAEPYISFQQFLAA